MPIFPFGTRSTEKKKSSGFTLFELSIVLGLLALLLALELPAVLRLLALRPDFEQEVVLYFTTLCDESLYRGRRFWLQFDPKEKRFQLVKPIKTEWGLEFAPHTEPFLPEVFSLPASYEVMDIQTLQGEKFYSRPVLIRVLPSGWIDPFTLHLREKDDRSKEATLWVSPTTCKVEFLPGYRERTYEEE